MAYEQVESTLSVQASRRRGHGRLAIVLTALLLAASLASAAPVGGNASSEYRGFKVLDKNGKLVGYTVTENMVAREVNPSVWVTFFVHPAAGVFDSGAIYVYYMTPDCTGTTYITHYSTFSEGTRVGSKMYYPKDYQQLTPRSVRVTSPAGDGACYAAPAVPGVYGVAATVDVNSFGLELPFKAQQ